MGNEKIFTFNHLLADEEALQASDRLRNFNSDENIYFDFTGIKFARPYGMLCLAQSIRDFRDRHSSKITFKSTRVFDNLDIEDNSSSPLEKLLKSRPDDLRNACGYMGLVGFFDDAGFDYGNKVAETIPESTKYIPITKISFQKFNESYEDSHELLEQEAKKLATLLVPNEQATEYRKVLQYAIFEALRNAMEHSESDYVRICGQRWDSASTGSRAEIAILDDGIGVLESLKENTLHSELNSERDALKKAVKAGVSRRHISKRSNSPMDNSGYGLYMLKRIGKDFGSFLLNSNGTVLRAGKNPDNVEDYSKITGTSLRITINLNELLKLGSLHENLKRYRDESKSPVKPSASSMASNIK